MKGLDSYFLSPTTPRRKTPDEWAFDVAQIEALEAQLRRKYSWEEPGADPEGYANWLKVSCSALPAGVFIWADEFQSEYLKWWRGAIHVDDPDRQDPPFTEVPARTPDAELDVFQGFGVTACEESLKEQYRQQAQWKVEHGRYTLEEASKLFAQNGDARADELLKSLVEAANSGVLPMHEPGKTDRYVYGVGKHEIVREFYEETYWDDLNSWLERERPRIRFRFLTPSIANSDLLRETVYNGGPIDWRYWSALSNITPMQGALLAFFIDPITWPNGAEYKQGPIPTDIRTKITRLSQLLESRNSKWSLGALIDVLKDEAPSGMRAAVYLEDRAKPAVLEFAQIDPKAPLPSQGDGASEIKVAEQVRSGEENTFSPRQNKSAHWTEDEFRSLLALVADGKNQKEIAELYGVTPQSISKQIAKAKEIFSINSLRSVVKINTPFS